MPPQQKWSFSGPFGKFDRAQLQRGFKVYREVCQACHGLVAAVVPQPRRAGRPGLHARRRSSAIAAEYKVKDGPNDAGEMFERAGRPADRFPPPFPNEKAARAANGGALPPDLSVIAKARTYERGFPWFLLDLVHAVSGAGPRLHRRAADGLRGRRRRASSCPPGRHYNKYFPGHAIAMPKPLSDGQVDLRRRLAADASRNTPRTSPPS